MYRNAVEPVAWHPRWLYGDAWERWPIARGERWRIGPHVVRCHDIEADPPPLSRVDLVYTDPPWGPGNAGWWRTKAGVGRRVAWAAFCEALLRHVGIGDVVYVEMGARWSPLLEEGLRARFAAVELWPITYYARQPSQLLRAGPAPVDRDYGGMDDAFTPFAAMIAERPRSVYDPCAGLGTTAIAAVTAGAEFVGGELHPRRAAVIIERLACLTGETPRRG